MAKPTVSTDSFPFYRCLYADCKPVWREGGLESARRHIVVLHDPQRLAVTRNEVAWNTEPDLTADVDVELTSLPGRAMFMSRDAI